MGQLVKRSGYLTAWMALLFSVGIKSETLIVQADDWCPVNCEKGDEKPGFLIELATQIFAEAGVTVVYATSSWAHAIEDVRQGEAGALVGAGKLDAPDFIFGDVFAGVSRQCFYTRANNEWRYTGVQSLRSIRLGVINDYSYGGEIDAYLKGNGSDDMAIQVASGEHALKSNVRKVEADRVDAILENVWVMKYYLAKYDTGPDLIEAGCRSPDIPIYLAFSPSLPASQRYSEIFDKGMLRYRKDGRLAEIMKHYGLHGD